MANSVVHKMFLKTSIALRPRKASRPCWGLYLLPSVFLSSAHIPAHRDRGQGVVPTAGCASLIGKAWGAGTLNPWPPSPNSNSRSCLGLSPGLVFWEATSRYTLWSKGQTRTAIAFCVDRAGTYRLVCPCTFTWEPVLGQSQIWKDKEDRLCWTIGRTGCKSLAFQLQVL